MPSEKFKISKASRSIRHAAQNFFGTFSVSPNGPQSTSTSYPIVGGNIAASIHEDPESHLDRRSAHNALERQRRETLNSKFQELAHALPALQTVRRPSKTMIVAKSLEYVTKSIQRENHYVNQIKELRKQNERLRKQAKVSKLANIHKHQSSTTTNKRNATLSTCTISTTSTEGPPPMTPPLSSSSSNTSSVTMQHNSAGHSNNIHQMPSSPMVEMNASRQHQQMSPPLTPETPNKKQRTMSPLMDTTTWADPSMMLMTSMPTSTSNSTIHSNATSHQGDMLMMLPPQQWQAQGNQDPMFSTSSLDLYAINNNNNMMYNSPPVTVTAHSSAMLQDASHYMSISDPTINSMLFSPYRWQDNPPVYHPTVAKSSDPLYLA